MAFSEPSNAGDSPPEDSGETGASPDSGETADDPSQEDAGQSELSARTVLSHRPEGVSVAEGPPLFPNKLEPLSLGDATVPFASLSAQACNACHGEVHDQWAASGHATASTNPVYRAAVAALGDPVECRNCHLPLISQWPNLARGPGSGPSSRIDNPAYQASLALEGVTCVACHLREGLIVGPRDLPAGVSPHPIVASARLSSVEACSHCHQMAVPGAEDSPFLDTHGEWAASSFGQVGIVCQECHMPRVTGRVAGSRFAAFASHELTGNRDPMHLARALTLEVDLRTPSVQRGEAVKATAKLINTGAGHAVPTGDPSHALELSFALLGAEGELTSPKAAHTSWFERTMSSAPPFKETGDSRIGPGSSKSVDFSFIPAKKTKPGVWTLEVTVAWWAMRPDEGARIGLEPEQLKVVVARQLIPVAVH